MLLTLNELSYASAVSESQAKSWYDIFFETCLKIEKDLKIKLSITFSISPREFNFYPTLPFIKWLHLQEKDNKSSILLMLTKAPIIHEYPYYKIGDLEGKGIAYACENENLLISFASNSFWESQWLSILKEQLNELGEIEQEELQIRNCYNSNFVEHHYPFIKIRLKHIKLKVLNGIRSGVELWRDKTELFPNLIFCESTEFFLKNLTSDNELFGNLFKKLYEFDLYFSNWENGDFDKDALTGNVRLESDTRIRKYSNHLLITGPDNTIRLFSLHCDVGSWGYRMHFYPDTILRKCIIGYIGKKIGT